MNEYVDTCSWKMVDPSKFVMGQEAERCGEVATIRVIRPNRKTDLFLCECHLNNFIDAWGLHYNVEVICPEPVAYSGPPRTYHLPIRETCIHGRLECECGGNP